MVDALFEIGKSAARKHVADLRGNCRLERFFQNGAHQVGYTFGNLERDVTHESIGDDYVDVTVEQVAALNIANKVQGQRLQQLERFASQQVALGFFFADRE